MPYTQSVRDTPRISLNKLGEYMTASPSRRRSIVRDQKRPKDAIVAQGLRIDFALEEVAL